MEREMPLVEYPGSSPWCPSSSLFSQIELTLSDPRASPHSEVMGLALPKLQSILVMLWSLKKLNTPQLRIELALAVDSPLLMASCIPECITTRNRSLSSINTIYFRHLSPMLRYIYFPEYVNS